MGLFPTFENPEAIKKLAVSQNKFSRDLYLALSKETEGNLFFSPFSVMTALAMAHMGSRGSTSDQIDKVMHFSQDKSEIKSAFKEIVSDFKKDVDEYELNTSNMMYVSHALSVLDDFHKSLVDHFLSTSKMVDFQTKAEEVRQEINSAVEKETKSKIKDLLGSGMIKSSTVMVLVNAVYFKGFWQNKFKECDTRDEDFYVTPSTTIQIPMMHIKDKFRYSPLKSLNANLLSMDYKGGRLSMVIVLPEAKDGLAELEAKMVEADLMEWDRRSAQVEVEVTLPKFKLEQSFSLPAVLKKMGITELFEFPGCDLSGIDGTKSLVVSEVVHKSFIEVNEEGSEAAAATAVLMMRCAMPRPRPPQIFIADHPFLFQIVDRHSGLSLFMGKYTGN